jgi:hypothetical protein
MMKKFVSGSYRCTKKTYQSELLFSAMNNLKEGQKIAIATIDELRIFQLIKIKETKHELPFLQQ